MAKSVVFSRLMEEYGSLEEEEAAKEEKAAKKRTRRKESKGPTADDADSSEEAGPKKADNAALMQTEERNTGAVTWTVYKGYLRYAGGVVWAPFILTLLTVTQVAQGKYPRFQHFITIRLCVLLKLVTIYSSGFGRRRAYMDLDKAITWRFMPDLVCACSHRCACMVLTQFVDSGIGQAVFTFIYSFSFA